MNAHTGQRAGMGDAPARWTARLLLLRPKPLKGKVGFWRLGDG